MEINGFTIDTFNQYHLDEKAKVSTCPLCSADRKKKTDKCMKLHWDTGLGVCFHCGERIQLHTYKKNAEKVVYSKPVFNNKTDLSANLVKWFEGRKISQRTLKMMKITEGMEWMPQTKKDENTVQFNYFRNGELVNTKFRDGRKNFKMVKDAERIFYNIDSCAISKDIIIVEGEIDALSFIEIERYNVVSMPNGSTLKGINMDYLDNCIQYFENKEKVYLAIDNDEAGQNTTKEFIRRFGSERCYIVDFKDCKDANEYHIKYGAKALDDCLESATLSPIEGVSSVLDWEDKFKEYLLHGMQSGFKIGLKSFDDIFSTYTGQFITVTGKPSSGKSDFVDQMCLGYQNLYGWKTAIASPENKPNQIHAGKIISKVCGKWVNSKEDIASAWFEESVRYMNDTFKYIDLKGTYDLDEVLSKTKDLIFRFGIKVLVLDPYNKIRLRRSLNKNINDYTSDYLCTIDDFARKYDILIIIVAHPRKPGAGETKDYEPSFYDVKGGGEFYDMSPHGLLVHRDYDNDVVKIKVLKVKFAHLGKNDKHTFLKWNEDNGRYMDFAHQHEKASELSGLICDNTNHIVEKANNAEQPAIDYNHEPQEREDDFYGEAKYNQNSVPF